MKKDGFSLVELVAVLAVIGIILLVTVPTILGVMEDSKDNGYRDAIRSLFKSIQLEVTNDRTVTSGDLTILDFSDKLLTSGHWEYIPETDNIILTNILLSDGRVVCNLEYRERSEKFPIYDSCPD